MFVTLPATAFRRPVQFQLPDQCAARDAEQVRGSLLVAASLREHSADGLLFQAVERIRVLGRAGLSAELST